MWNNAEWFIKRQNFFSIENNPRYNGFAGFYCQSERTAMKRFQWLICFIAGTFRIDTHMQSHGKNFFIFV